MTEPVGDVWHRRPVRRLTLHEPLLLLVGQRKPRVLHAERTGDLFLKELGIGLLGRFGQSDGEQVEAEIGIEHRRAGREQQGLLLQPSRKSVAGDRCERIVVRPSLVGYLARQPGGMRGQIDQADRLGVAARS